MIKREELNGKDVKGIQQLMMQSTAEFEAQLETMTLEELDATAKEIGEIMDADNERTKNVVYKLPPTCEFDGKHHAEAIAKTIAKFIESIEVEWRATLGIYQACKFWSKDFIKAGNLEVPYNVLDSTLRMLGGLKFKGMTQCKNIMVINNWLSNVHTEYVADNIYKAYLGQLFDDVSQRHDKLVGEKEPADEAPHEVTDRPFEKFEKDMKEAEQPEVADTPEAEEK